MRSVIVALALSPAAAAQVAQQLIKSTTRVSLLSKMKARRGKGGSP